MTRLPCGLALLAAAALAHAQATAPQPTVDPKAYPALTAMLAALQNGSEASRYCAQTGGLFLEADVLVRKGVPFREAHGIVGSLVRHSIAEGKQLSELSDDELASFSDQLGDDYRTLLSGSGWIESKQSQGGTSSASLDRPFELAQAILDACA